MNNLVVRMLIGFLAFAPTAFAQTGATNLGAIRSQQAEIRLGVQSRAGIYQPMSEENRGEVLRVQAAMLRAIGDKESASELNPQQRTDVLNALEQIQALITQKDDERLVCENRAQLGSKHKKRECVSLAQRREQREAAKIQISTPHLDSNTYK